MFGYIKEQINAQRKSVSKKTSAVMQPADVPNEVITEYAHLFQELDDITEEGIDANSERKLDLAIDLGGGGDIEVESIEIGLDGNIKDIPGDTSTPNVAEYATMKTYDKFFEEAANKIQRLPRESDASYEKRVSTLADQMYEEYCIDAEEIGAFGFTKMSITDEKVPDKINVNLGSMQDGSNAEFVSKVPVYFATNNKDHQITKKQLDSVRLVQNGALKNMGSPLKAYMESTYDMPSDKSVWDYCTPKNIFVPKGNGDSFCVVLEYVNEITGKNEYFGWTQPVVFQEECLKLYDVKKLPENTITKTMKSLGDLQKDMKENYMIFDGKPFEDGYLVSGYMKNDKKKTVVVFYKGQGAQEYIKNMKPSPKVLGNTKAGGGRKSTRLQPTMGGSHYKESYVEACERVNMESFVYENSYEWKPSAIQDIINQEAKNTKPKKRPSRFFQETDEVEITQEGMFDAGFGNLRSKLAQALSDKFTVSNVVKGMNGKDAFTISGHIDDIGDVKTTVTNKGNGCEVVSRGDEGFKRNFANIALHAAFEKIKELFEKPRLLFAESYIQEGIDLGTGDAGSDTDNAGGDPPAIDEGTNDQATQDSTSTTDTSADTNAQSGDGADTEPKETAAVNDVSDQIAEKVADQTKADATDDEITFPAESDGGDSSSNDSGQSVDFGSTSDEPTSDETSSVDDQLDDLDNAAAENDELSGEEGDENSGSIENGDEIGDIESMSMEEIMSNASEKLKSMPLGELKSFLSGNSTSDFQEAFILTKKNINKEVDIHLRKALGILNDNKMNVDKLLFKFKFEGRALNRVLVKAAKTKEVYSSDEQEAIKKLNTALSELLVSLKKSNSASYVSSVKRKISDFTKQSKIVAAFVEDKMEKPVQEGFVQEGLFLSSSNAKKRLGRRLSPVHSDLSSIVSASDKGTFTKGKLNKMYKPVHRTLGYSPGSDGGITTSRDYDVNTPHSENINDLQRILSKIIRKPKVQTAFSNDEISMISDLNDLLDDLVDMIEAVIYDNSSADNKIILDKIVAISKKILAIIDNLDQACSVMNDSSESPVDDKSEEETSMDVETTDDIDADEAIEETPDTDAFEEDTEEIEEDDE